MLQVHATHTPRSTPDGSEEGDPPAGTLSPPNTCMLEPNGPVGGSKPAPESMSVQVEATPTPTGEERRPHAGEEGRPRGPTGVPETPGAPSARGGAGQRNRKMIKKVEEGLKSKLATNKKEKKKIKGKRVGSA